MSLKYRLACAACNILHALHAVKVARELIDKCDAEKRAMNADETGKYEAAMSDFDSLDAQIKQEQRVKSLEKEIELPLNPAKQEFKSDAEKAAIEQRAAFTNICVPVLAC